MLQLADRRMMIATAMIVLAAAPARACTEESGRCICETADGDGSWDLTELAATEITTTGDTTGCTACQGNWNYHFSICGNVVMPQAIGCVSSQTRSAYRIDDYPTPTSRWCEYMAEDATTEPPTVTATDDGLALAYTYTSGTISRTLTVNLLCNGEDLPAPEAGVAGGADVVMNWPTAAACTGSGMTGWYIVIFAGLAAGVYVGGGIGYVKRNDPSADIKTAHPHTEYWQQVPGLVSDGILFTRVTLSTNVKALEFLAPPDGGYAAVDEEAAVGGKREQGGLLSPDADADGADPPKKQWAGIPDAREVDEGASKKKKKKKAKKKPKPSAAAGEADEI